MVDIVALVPLKQFIPHYSSVALNPFVNFFLVLEEMYL